MSVSRECLRPEVLAVALIATFTLLAPATAAGAQDLAVPAAAAVQLSSDDQMPEDGMLHVGPTAVGGTTYRALLTFDLLEGDLAAMSTARLHVTFPGCYMGPGPELRAFPVVSAWDGVSWANQPEVGGDGIVADDSGCPHGRASFDVTQIVNDWASGSAPNLGIELRGYESATGPQTYYDAGTGEETNRLDRAILQGEDPSGAYVGPALEFVGVSDPNASVPPPVPLEISDGGVIESEVTTHPASGGASAQAATTCKTAWVWRGRKHPVFGYFYWKYFEQVTWCWRGGFITSAFRHRWAECCLTGSGWTFEGHIGSIITGGKEHTYYDAWTQGKFKQCYAWCVTTKLPWVRLRVKAGGDFDSWHGG